MSKLIKVVVFLAPFLSALAALYVKDYLDRDHVKEKRVTNSLMVLLSETEDETLKKWAMRGLEENSTTPLNHLYMDLSSLENIRNRFNFLPNSSFIKACDTLDSTSKRLFITNLKLLVMENLAFSYYKLIPLVESSNNNEEEINNLLSELQTNSEELFGAIEQEEKDLKRILIENKKRFPDCGI